MQNRTINIRLNKLIGRQRDILESWFDKSITYLTVSCGRQVGKTQTMLQIAISNSLRPLYGQDSCRSGIFLPTYKQARMAYKRTSDMLMPYKMFGFRFNKSELRITFPNGSEIEYWTSDNDNCRGYTYQYLFVDEACFVKADIWSEAILATVTVALSNGVGKVLLTSTPKEKNWFYDYFNQDRTGYKSIKFTSYESGLQSKEVLDDIRIMTPKAVFDNEYMAEFMDGGSSLFDVSRINYITSEITDFKGVVAAIDWGIESDYTVLTILNRHKQLIYSERWVKIDWDVLIDKIVTILNKYGRPLTYCEINGIGNMPYKTLKKKYGNARDWVTSEKSKLDIMNKLSSDIIIKDKKDSLYIPKNDELVKELANFGFFYRDGKMKFYNIKSDIKDDQVMSLAIANYNHRVYNGI